MFTAPKYDAEQELQYSYTYVEKEEEVDRAKQLNEVGGVVPSVFKL